MKQKSLCCVIALLLCFSCLATGCSHDKNKGGNTSSGSSSNSVSSENNSSSDSSGDSSQPQEESKPSFENTTSVPNGSSSTGGSTDKNVQINYTPIDDVNIVVPNGAKSTQKWTATDIVLNAKKTYGNPYTEQAINCQFTGPQGQKMTIPAFWDGGQKWVIRFAPPVVGKWTYTVSAADTADAGLHKISGELYCTKYTGNLDIYKHGFLRVSNDKRSMTHRDGTPFFWLADTHWMGLSHREHLYDSNDKRFPSMFKGMVDVRAKQGYTVYQMNFFLSESGDNGYINGEPATWNEGGRVWTDNKKWESPNTKFFSNCDERIQYVAKNGLVSALGLDWGPYAYSDYTVSAYKAIARYIVARYSAYPIIWNTCGEARMNSPYWAEVARYIDKIDPYQHPTTLHSGVETTDFGYKSDEYRGEDWFDFVMLQTGHVKSLTFDILNSWKNKYNRTATLPFLEGEACYEGIAKVPKNLTRKMAYTSIMCGSFGYSYGAEGIWNAIWDENDTFQLWGAKPVPWYKAIDGENGAQMKYLKQIFTSVPWWELKPYNSIISWYKQPGTTSDPLLKSNSDRTSIMIYYPIQEKPISYDFIGTISRLNPKHTYDAKWVNPRDGKTTTAAAKFKPNSDGEWKTPAPPSNTEDWVLLINDRVRPNMKNAKIIAASYENGSYPYVTGEAELPEIKGA